MACTDRQKAADVCSALLVAGARIVTVCDGQHDYTVWYEHERAGDETFQIEIGRASKDVKEYEAKKSYWDDQYKASHAALDKLAETVDNPCVEMQEHETLADALVRYVIDRYVKTDGMWREIHGLPPLEK